MFQTKVVEKIKIPMLGSVTFSRKSCGLRDNVEKCGRAGQATADDIIRHIRFASCINMATDTQSEYVVHIAFPRKKRLRERASILHYTLIACLVPINSSSGDRSINSLNIKLVR
jgi:hypothetical protein